MADWLCLLFMLYFFSSNYLDLRLSLFSLGIIRTSSIPFSLNRSLLPLFLGYSYPLLTLGLPSAWLLEGLSNLSRSSRLALSHLYPRPTLCLSYAYATPLLLPSFKQTFHFFIEVGVDLLRGVEEFVLFDCEWLFPFWKHPLPIPLPL